MKIHSLGAELFHADRQTDRHEEANSRFSQFCEMRLKSTSFRGLGQGMTQHIGLHHEVTSTVIDCTQNKTTPRNTL